MLDLIWEPDAAAQLDEIIDYIGARHFSAAERLERAFYDKLEMACKFPEIVRPGKVSGTREIVVHPNYLAIYQITATAIDVIRVLHARRQYP